MRGIVAAALAIAALSTIVLLLVALPGRLLAPERANEPVAPPRVTPTTAVVRTTVSDAPQRGAHRTPRPKRR